MQSTNSMEKDRELPLERYRSLMEDGPIATVDVLFFNSERTKTLLGKRTNEPYAGEWYSFGGRLLKNEEFADAALRIAQQEVGVSLSKEDLRQAGIINEVNPNSIFEGINYHAVNVYFACILDDRAYTLDTQHNEARWIDVNETALRGFVREKIAGALRAL